MEDMIVMVVSLDNGKEIVMSPVNEGTVAWRYRTEAELESLEHPLAKFLHWSYAPIMKSYSDSTGLETLFTTIENTDIILSQG